MRRISFILAAILIIAGCGSGNQNLAGDEGIDCDSLKSKAVAPGGQQLCGGYTEAREPSDEEYQLFRKVTDPMEGMTFTPLTVQTQVVAGINYKFYCRFSDGSGQYSPGHCWLTIYKPLPGQGEPKVTSFEIAQ